MHRQADPNPDFKLNIVPGTKGAGPSVEDVSLEETPDVLGVGGSLLMGVAKKFRRIILGKLGFLVLVERMESTGWSLREARLISFHTSSMDLLANRLWILGDGDEQGVQRRRIFEDEH